jgi:DNA polymerase
MKQPGRDTAKYGGVKTVSGKIEKLHESIATCQVCGFLKERWRFQQAAHGLCRAKIMVVGESAYKPSIEVGRYYSAGVLRNTLAGTVDLEQQCYLTDVVKCDKSYLDIKEQLEAAALNCRQFLFEEIEVIQPKVIIAIGELAFRYLTGIAGNFTRRQDDGERYLYKNVRVIPIIHPSYGNVHYGKRPWQSGSYHSSIRNIFIQAVKM